MRDDQFLVSSTDQRGIIRFANQDFVAISGYSRDELVGQPHNLVRHPDMPAVAFADLWATLKARQSWVGVVKNRSKDGGFYWVRAAVSPVVEKGEVTGYISVRVKPTAAEIDLATRAYADVRHGGGGWAVARGRLRRNGLGARLGRALAPLSRRIAVIVLAMIAVTSAGSAVALLGLNQSNAALGGLVEDELGTAVNMQTLAMAYHGCWQHLVLAARPDSDLPGEIAKARADMTRAEALLTSSRNLEMDPAETAFNNDLDAGIHGYFDEVVKPALAQAEAGKRGSVAALLADKGLGHISHLDELTSQQAQLQKAQGAAFFKDKSRDFQVYSLTTAALAGLALVIGLLTAWLVPRSLRRNLGGLRDGMDALARGQLDSRVDLDRSDEFGPVNLAFIALQTRIAYEQTSGHEMRLQLLRDFDASIGNVLSDLTASVTSLKDTAQEQGAAAGRLSGSAQTVAASASEMSASIREIATQATQASTLATNASQQASGSREAMAKLSKAANEITAVAKLIADIAEQTNLLALNATIEAARAGDVGRGFAVVAGEVKSLANQTQGATGDINRKIAAVQGDTQAAVASLEALVAGIGQLNDAAHAIAAAVEEQSAVTEEIARNAEQAAASAKVTGDSAQTVATAAAGIARTDEALEKAVARFKSGSAA